MKQKIVKKRLDCLLVEKGFAESNDQAQRLILAGQIKVKDLPILLKTATLVKENSEIELLSLPRYVSRGGEKLEAALNYWKIEPQDRICLDVGCSTGGFTDCLLQKGAKKIIAVDVGHGQFHYKLREDSRISLYEKCHILKWIPPWNNIKELPSLIVVDLSFISLTKILKKIHEITHPNWKNFNLSQLTIDLLVLIKPQFESERKWIRKGILKDQNIRQEIIEKIVQHSKTLGFEIKEHFPCPVLGLKGNEEEWLYLVTKVT
ncbi:MAG: hypothetical protein A3I11_04025 [Elusimicrobia bacterium RIFCSPLOWO2_02_FULL_39_32]|nr:MAG: hypothetical protein A3B80_02600 [Elusimicrobia bacterium RIFCSPHIGHO2_02_FULL_39_36]OGR92871.1 MAG: hypothetical protein A3I11_04025 [Elusimicrobia bacterium RIFCSPLOWO2_02_FULL_39_32]OGR99655.1 MAG: hypothetical protein A3G85_01390 [Elusimicrobia bacterium RIFCSPLOWO2_12_FULL_39_28]